MNHSVRAARRQRIDRAIASVLPDWCERCTRTNHPYQLEQVGERDWYEARYRCRCGWSWSAWWAVGARLALAGLR